MALCGSSTCGCGVTSSPSTATAINGFVPTIDVSGTGVLGDPYDLTLNTDWADEVASAINNPNNNLQESDEYLRYLAGSDIDSTTSGTYTTWLTLGSITVPSWADIALVHFNVVGVYDVTSANNLYEVRLQLDAANGDDYVIRGFGINNRFGFGWTEEFTSLSTGSKTLRIQMRRTAGSGAIRAASGASAVSVHVRYRE